MAINPVVIFFLVEDLAFSLLKTHHLYSTIKLEVPASLFFLVLLLLHQAGCAWLRGAQVRSGEGGEEAHVVAGC